MWKVDGKTYYTDHETIENFCNKQTCCENCRKRVRLWCKFRSWAEKKTAKYIKTLN